MWRRLCLRKRLLLDGEEEGEVEGEVEEEIDEQIKESGCDASAVPRRLSFWARLYKTRSAVK